MAYSVLSGDSISSGKISTTEPSASIPFSIISKEKIDDVESPVNNTKLCGKKEGACYLVSDAGVLKIAIATGEDQDAEWVILDVEDEEAKSKLDALEIVQSRAIHALSSGSDSNGIRVVSNSDTKFGTADFTACIQCSLPDWTPKFYHFFFDLRGGSSGNGLLIQSLNEYPNNRFRVIFYSGSTTLILKSDVYDVVEDNSEHQLTISFKRETIEDDGAVSFYLDGILFSTIVLDKGSPLDISNNNSMYFQGSSTSRNGGSTTRGVHLYNRCLSSQEVLEVYLKGVNWNDVGASQTVLESGTLEVGKRYKIDTFATGDDFSNVGAANESGNEFIATGATPTAWANSSSLRQIGCVAQYEPEGVQPSPGLWLDSSGNGHHAKIPNTYCYNTKSLREGIIEWVNTWTASSASQYIGGVNEEIFPINSIRIEWIRLETETIGVNITIGDQTDADRFVTSVALTTELDATVAHRNHDGTNRKLLIKPSESYTGSIKTTIKYSIV